MTNQLLIGILMISSLTFLTIGIGMVRAKETKESCFKKAKATITARGTGGYECISPVVQFMDGTREVTSRMIYEISDKPEYKEGAELDVLYCPKRVLGGIYTQSVILDDDGVSLKRLRRLYFIGGSIFIVVGIAFAVVTVVLGKAWL